LFLGGFLVSTTRARRSTHDHQLAKPAEYRDPKTTKPEMWAWEFLRRNPNYRKDWEQCAALPMGTRVALASPARILALKYGLCDMMDPSCSAERCAPGWETDEITAYGEFLTIAYGQGNEIVITRVDSRAITTEGRYHLPVSAEEVYVPFNLARPIEAQLKRAKRLLGELQTDFKGQHPELMVRRRARADKYRTYLQLLDAEEAGANHDDMAAALYPHIPNDPPDYTGREKVRDALAAAKRLRDGDYRYLLL
jgi:hypothetical protein